MTHLKALAPRFRFNEKLLERATEGFSDADWLRRPAPGTSHAFWLLGHISVARRNLFRGLGGDLTLAPWESSFGKGSKPEDGAFPLAPHALLADFMAMGRRLEERMTAMRDDEAAAPYGRTFPDGSSTRDGVAHFLHWHETYHLGQIGLLRRVCGKPGVA